MSSHYPARLSLSAWSSWHTRERPVSVIFETETGACEEVHLTVPQTIELLGFLASTLDFNKMADSFRAKPVPEPIEAPTIHEEDSEP